MQMVLMTAAVESQQCMQLINETVLHNRRNRNTGIRSSAFNSVA